MVREEKGGRQVVESNVILDARVGIAKTEHDRRFDRRVKIGDPVVVQEIDVVVVNGANIQAQEVMKAARDAGIDAGRRRALNVRIAGVDRKWRIQVRVQIDRLFGCDRRAFDGEGRRWPGASRWS